jgi:uncharacterized protein YndB with AHSA1/START domain
MCSLAIGQRCEILHGFQVRYLSRARFDLRRGGKWQCSAITSDGTLSQVHGTILEVTHPTLLAYTWNASYAPIPETTVRFELLPIATNRTRVTVTHSGFTEEDGFKQAHE